MTDEPTSAPGGDERRRDAPSASSDGDASLPIVPSAREPEDGLPDLETEEFEGDRRYGREDIADK